MSNYVGKICKYLFCDWVEETFYLNLSKRLLNSVTWKDIYFFYLSLPSEPIKGTDALHITCKINPAYSWLHGKKNSIADPNQSLYLQTGRFFYETRSLLANSKSVLYPYKSRYDRWIWLFSKFFTRPDWQNVRVEDFLTNK